MRGLVLLAFFMPLFAPLWVMAQALPALEVLSPRGDERSTVREFVNVLGRTAPGAQVKVSGEAVTVFSTGVFARDRVPLVLGKNRIAIEAVLASGEQLTRQLDIERLAPPAPVQWPADRLFINGASLQPAETVRVAPGEGLEVAAQATPGQRVEARLAGQRWQPLTEAPANSGRYRALLAFEGHDDVAAAPVQLRVTAQALPREGGVRTLSALTMGRAGQWRNDPERLFIVGADEAELLHGLHDVRLGGPNLAELPAGVLLRATGQRGDWLRVQLTPDVIDRKSVV